ncbi:MAG: hydrogenase small subunit [Bacteroidales bacterium]
MNDKELTAYQHLRKRGISRRDFLKFCGIMGSMLGLKASGVEQVIDAFMTKPRIPVLWEHFQECTCCSESFVRCSHPIVEQVLLEMISLNYSDSLMAAAGTQALAVEEDTIKNNYGKYILLVEGAVPLGNEGFCTIGGKSALDVLEHAASGAKAIIAWGNCASSGCIQHARPNPTDAQPIHKIIKGKPIINVQGCPPIADVMAGVITYMLTFDKVPELDQQLRPLVFYGRRIHDTCYRRPCYDAGLFVQSFDDENAKKGYCLYYMGCKGPNTFNSCAVIKWNLGVSYPIQSGHGCIGCAEPNFWDYEPFYKHIPYTYGFGVESNADKIGAGLAGIALGGVAAHAIATNIRKRKMIKGHLGEDYTINQEDTQETLAHLEKERDELLQKSADLQAQIKTGEAEAKDTPDTEIKK